MKRLMIVLALVLWSGLAGAQHNHGTKGPNGGKMQDVAGVHIELLVSGNALTLNALDEDNKPLSTAGYTASIQISAGSSRETVQLAPAGSSLKGEARTPPLANATYLLVIRTAAGKSGQAKF
ncbi:hypothetical protein [Reyranella sp.]|uniref:hypothetical protein n=1 Tax=Reyranella sp. TaxID=1929291 RepID=UPI003D1291F0